jgi:DNA-binding protein YbaB
VLAPKANPTFTGTVTGVTKSMVGLANVDNTADTAKPVSTAQQTALNLKANLASPTFTGTVGGITKSMVGLGSVDNTADTAKPVSTAQQTALNLKANLASPTFTGTVGGITASMVGLGNVDNTADLNKPVSTATQTALDAKEPLAHPLVTVTVNTTLTAASDITFVNSTTARTITLPDPTTVPIGQKYYVKNINTAATTVVSAGTSKTLDGAASQSLAQWAKAVYVSNGSQWFTVS